MSAAMQQQQPRAAIERLKKENARLQDQLAEQENQLAQQIERELEHIKQQLQQQGSSHPQFDQAETTNGNSPISGGKLILLQERLRHQKQRLDAVNSSNADRQQALLATSKRIAAAQQAAQHLNKQLAKVHEELTAVQQLEGAVQATGRKASELCDLLLSQDDEEQLAYSATAKQFAEMLMQPQQQGGTQAQAVPPAFKQSSCEESYTEEQAAAALEQLCSLLAEAGIAGCEAPAGTAEGVEPACCTQAQDRQAWLIHTLAQVQADNFSQFQLCSVANWLQQQAQSARCAQPSDQCL